MTLKTLSFIAATLLALATPAFAQFGEHIGNATRFECEEMKNACSQADVIGLEGEAACQQYADECATRETSK